MKRVAFTTALLSVTAFAAVMPTTIATADPLDAPAELQEKDKKASAQAQVIVLFASNAGTGVHACASHLKALSEPPLNAYDSYSCLSDSKVPLELKVSASMATPDKGKLSLILNEVKKREGKKPKYDVDVQIDDQDGEKYVSTNVKAPEGKYFFLAGPKFKHNGVDGVLIYALQMLAP